MRAETVLQDNVPSYDHCVDLQMGKKSTSIAEPSSLSTVSTTGSRKSLRIIDESQLDLSHSI